MAAYVQSISCALTPVVPVMAVIVTFLTHIGLGHDLSPAQVKLPYFSSEIFALNFSVPGIRSGRCHGGKSEAVAECST